MKKIIQNNDLKVTINLMGGSLDSVILKKKNNTEALYQSNDGAWKFKDVVIFPLIGKNEYEVDGIKYETPLRHGFIRSSLFEVKGEKENKITILFKANEESKALYPFNFIYELTYELKDNRLVVKPNIINLEKDKELPFMIGFHSAFNVNENANIKFLVEEKSQKLINGLISFDESFSLGNEIKLKDGLFKKQDTLVIKNDHTILKLDTGFGYSLFYKLVENSYIGIWTNPNNSSFICVEPWWGVSNYIDEAKNIYDIKYINKVKTSQSFAYSIDFELEQ